MQAPASDHWCPPWRRARVSEPRGEISSGGRRLPSDAPGLWIWGWPALSHPWLRPCLSPSRCWYCCCPGLPPWSECSGIAADTVDYPQYDECTRKNFPSVRYTAIETKSCDKLSHKFWKVQWKESQWEKSHRTWIVFSDHTSQNCWDKFITVVYCYRLSAGWPGRVMFQSPRKGMLQILPEKPPRTRRPDYHFRS